MTNEEAASTTRGVIALMAEAMATGIEQRDKPWMDAPNALRALAAIIRKLDQP